MAKSSKLIAVKRGKVLLVHRKRDQLWMFPGGRKRAHESEKDCLRGEIKEELPKLKLGRVRLWKEIDKAIWGKPRGIRLTPTSRYVRDKLFAIERSSLIHRTMSVDALMEAD